MDAKGKSCRLSTQRVPGVDVRYSPGTEGARIVPVGGCKVPGVDGRCSPGTEGARIVPCGGCKVPCGGCRVPVGGCKVPECIFCPQIRYLLWMRRG